MSKNSILASLKWVFAGGILFFLVRSGKLSYKDLEVFLSHPQAALSCLAIVAFVFLLAFYRWRFLLQSQGIPVSYAVALRLGMLGQFFSAIIPGTVGGDLVKAVYVARRFPEEKIKTVTTIFLDRFLGLFGMLVLGGLAFLAGRSSLVHTDNSAVIESLGWLLTCIAIGILLVFSFFPIIGRHLPPEAPKWINKLPGKDLLCSLYQVAVAYRHGVGALWFGLILSMFMHVLNVSALYLIASTVFGPAPWAAVTTPIFVVCSVLGLCAIAIPVAPMGLGIGQLAFAGIFTAVGGPAGNFGVAIITAFQLVNLVLNLSGSLFFATYRHEAQELRV